MEEHAIIALLNSALRSIVSSDISELPAKESVAANLVEGLVLMNPADRLISFRAIIRAPERVLWFGGGGHRIDIRTIGHLTIVVDVPFFQEIVLFQWLP